MKSTGVVRKIDELGRFVIPKEIRDKIGFSVNTPLEISVDGENILLKKYVDNNACVFCSSNENVKLFKGKYVCRNCIEDLTQ